MLQRIRCAEEERRKLVLTRKNYNQRAAAYFLELLETAATTVDYWPPPDAVVPGSLGSWRLLASLVPGFVQKDRSAGIIMYFLRHPTPAEKKDNPRRGKIYTVEKDLCRQMFEELGSRPKLWDTDPELRVLTQGMVAGVKWVECRALLLSANDGNRCAGDLKACEIYSFGYKCKGTTICMGQLYVVKSVYILHNR